jgi:PAS domain S-box-containing protein
MNTKTFSTLSESEKIDLLQHLQERVDELEHATTRPDLSMDVVLREVLQRLPILIFIADTELQITAIQGQPISHLITPDAIETARGQSVHRVFANVPAVGYDAAQALIGQTINQTIKYDEAAFRAYYQPLRKDNMIVGVLAVLSDIHELADTEAALHDSQTRLKAIFEQTQQFMCLLHTNGHILEVNYAALKYAGLHHQEVIGKPLWEMAWWRLDDNAMTLEQAFQQSLGGDIVQYETRMCGQGEIIADIDLTLKPIVNHKNQTTMILVEGHNITQRKLAEEQMRLALEKEKELSDLKSRFITFTSHEFRTPLAIIASSAYLLKRQGFDISEEMRDRHFNKIQNNVDQIAEMLDDILLLGHLRAKQMGVYAEEYPISHMTELLLKDFEKRYGNTHTFTLQSNPPDIRINADQTLLEQALNQLLKNAVNYSAVRGQVEVCLTLTDDVFTMQVRDNGIGILPEDINKIFDSFVRGSNVDNFSGTGLGLAIVKDVVELHYGTVAVESQPGKTIFTVTIPRHQPN